MILKLYISLKFILNFYAIVIFSEKKNLPKTKKGSEMSDEGYKEFLQKLSEVETSSPIAMLLTESPFCDKYDSIIIKISNI